MDENHTIQTTRNSALFGLKHTFGINESMLG
jgi:hypothetical protein